MISEKLQPSLQIFIGGVKVERVTEYKYLGTVLDNKLNFKKNTDFITYFLPEFTESVLTFSFLCWFGGLNVKSKNVLNKVVTVCGKVVGERQELLSQLYERRVERKARVIVDDNSHVLAKYYELLPSGRRFRVLKSNTVRICSQ